MAHKYIYDNAGRLTEREATTSSAGAGDSGKIVALDGSGRLDSSVMPSGIGAQTKTATASEALSAGDFVSFWNDSGTLKVRKADATSAGKEANGFVLSSVLSGASATVYEAGINTAVSGLTLGSDYFLATTAGGVTTTAPSSTGNAVQFLGRATGAAELPYEAAGRGWVKA